MTSIALIVWLISTFALGSTGSISQCDAFEECKFEKFSGVWKVEALGYRSAAFSDASEVAGDIYCNGANSCEGLAMHFGQGLAMHQYVYCDGFEACKDSVIEFADAFDYHVFVSVYADGFDALFNAAANVSTLHCAGERSCRDGHFVAEKVEASGAFSLADSTLICEGDCFFDGYYAGYGASVECGEGMDVCQVICLGSGCCGLSVAEGVELSGDIAYYAESSSNSSRYIACPPPQFPRTFVSDAIDEVYDMIELAEKFLALKSIAYDDYVAYGYDDELDDFDFAYIGCRAQESCSGMSHGLVSGGLMCSGSTACEFFDVENQHPSDASMLCLSEKGCRDLAVGPNNGGQILCAGGRSCQGAKLSVSRNSAIYCSGTESCSYAELSFGEDIEEPVVMMLGNGSALSASVNCEVDGRCAVYCDAYAKCETMTGPCDDNGPLGGNCAALPANVDVITLNVTVNVTISAPFWTSTSTTGTGANARSIEKEQDLGYDLIDSDDEAAEDSQDLAAVLGAVLAFVAVVAIGVALFYALRVKDGKAKKEEKAVADEMIVEEDVPDASAEMVTGAPGTM